MVCRRARDDGGPAIAGQLLVTPVTDGVGSYASMEENADGYVLTKALMDWFWDHYADADDRADPLASPLLAASLADLPPAAIFTAEFDPLRDQGAAYAEALAAAGVPVRYRPGRGQIHTSLTAVDLMLSSARPDGPRAVHRTPRGCTLESRSVRCSVAPSHGGWWWGRS